MSSEAVKLLAGLLDKVVSFDGVELAVVIHEGLPVEYKSKPGSEQYVEEVAAMAASYLASARMQTLGNKPAIRSILSYDGKFVAVISLEEGLQFAILGSNRDVVGRLVDSVQKTVEGRGAKCPKCGADLELEKYKCPSCGSTIPFTAPVCPFCGALVDPKPCPRCGSLVSFIKKVKAPAPAAPAPKPAAPRRSRVSPGAVIAAGIGSYIAYVLAASAVGINPAVAAGVGLIAFIAYVVLAILAA